MKKKVTTLALLAALLTIIIGGATLAYFTDEEEATNTFTVGNVDITLTEDNWVAPENVVPGIAYDKDPVIENTGSNPAYIRVKVTVSDAVAFKNALAKHSLTDYLGLFADYDNTKWINEKYEDTDPLVYSVHYSEILEPGDNTGAIFTSFEIPAEFDNEDMASLGEDFTITITAEAIQSEGFADSIAAFNAFDN